MLMRNAAEKARHTTISGPQPYRSLFGDIIIVAWLDAEMRLPANELIS